MSHCRKSTAVATNIGLGASIALLVGLFFPLESHRFLPILFPLQLGISVFLNTLITSVIVTLLFRHRRMIVRTFGREQHLPLLNIMTILTESAALIVFADIVMIVTVCMPQSSSGDLVSQVQTLVQVSRSPSPQKLCSSPQHIERCKPIASLLIIDRVSRGLDYFSHKEEETSQLTTLRFSHPLGYQSHLPREESISICP